MSRLTDFLKLHIWEIPEDNNEKFDYVKSIAENFEKVDTGVKDAVDKFTEPLSYKGEVTKIQDLPTTATNGDIYNVTSENKNYIYNGTNWVEYSSTLDLTYLENNTKTTQTTEVSEELTIENCAGVKGKLDINSGKSEQATSIASRNICPNEWELGQYTTEGTKEELENRIRVPYLIPCKPNTSYWVNMFTQDYDIKFIIRGFNSSKEFVKNYSAINNSTTFTTQADEYYLGITVYDVNSTTSDILNLVKTGTIRPFICLNSETDKSYTEFIPNKPSPDYPSRIRNVGDNINIFNENGEVTNLYINSSGVEIVGANNDQFIKQVFEPKNSNYIMSFNKNVNNGYVRFTYYNEDTFISRETSNTNNYIFSVPKNCTKIDIRTNTINKYFTNLKIQEGSISTSYTPYNCGSADFKVENKNLFDKNKITTIKAVINIVNGKIQANNNTKLIYLKVKSNTTYTVSKIVSSRFAIGSCNGIPVAGTTTCNSYIGGNTESKLTITTNENDNYLCIYYYYSQEDTLTEQEILDSIQLEEGNIATDYVEHQEQIKSFPFTEGQVLHEEDYLSNSGTHQNRETIVLTGNETTWTTRTIGEIRLFEIYLPKYAFGNTSDNFSCFSHFKNNLDLSEAYTARVMNNLLAIHYDDVSTVNEWKAYLAEQYANGTPVTVEYRLAKEIVIPYTTEQEEAYYELQHLLMYEGYTNITCIDEIKPDIQGTYYFNNELNNSYGERLDEVDESIKELQDNVDVLNEYNKDTGWKRLVVLSSGSGYYRKIGNMVNMVLKCTPTATYQTILNIPDGILPKLRLIRYTKKSTENKLGTFGLNPSDKKLWFYTGDVNTEYEIDFMYFTD